LTFRYDGHGLACTREVSEIGWRPVALGKKVVPHTWDRVGEGVGFFKCGPEAGRDLIGLLEQVIDDSQGICEYEDALYLLVCRQRVEAVSVTGLPWTEVDFALAPSISLTLAQRCAHYDRAERVFLTPADVAIAFCC
jgi:hypothetical protein